MYAFRAEKRKSDYPFITATIHPYIIHNYNALSGS